MCSGPLNFWGFLLHFCTSRCTLIMSTTFIIDSITCMVYPPLTMFFFLFFQIHKRMLDPGRLYLMSSPPDYNPVWTRTHTRVRVFLFTTVSAGKRLRVRHQHTDTAEAGKLPSQCQPRDKTLQNVKLRLPTSTDTKQVFLSTDPCTQWCCRCSPRCDSLQKTCG